MSKSPAVKKDEESESGALVTMHTQMPAEFAADLAGFAGAGVSERASDFAMPFLMIAQSNSPQLKRQTEKYIQGLEAGDIFNTATGEYWRANEGIIVIQSWFEKALVEWIPRSDGGGWVATYEIDNPIEKIASWVENSEGRRTLRLPNGHDLVETSYHFVVLAETGELGVVGMTSTSLACSRQWQTLLKRIKMPVAGSMEIAPAFARAFRLTTAYKKKDNNDWFVWAVADVGWAVGHPVYHSGFKQAKLHFEEARDKGVMLGRPPESTPDETTVDGHVDDGDTPI